MRSSVHKAWPTTHKQLSYAVFSQRFSKGSSHVCTCRCAANYHQLITDKIQIRPLSYQLKRIKVQLLRINGRLSCLHVQVNLATSSIRPGQPADWQASMQDALQAAVAASKADITVFTGTWQHDVDQAQLITHHPNVQLKVWL